MRSLPFPSQLPPTTCLLPLHSVTPQGVPLAYFRQAPAPLQVPSWSQELAPSSAHSLSGSVAMVTGAHVPSG